MTSGIIVKVGEEVVPLEDVTFSYIDPDDLLERVDFAFGYGMVKVTRNKLIKIASDVNDLVMEKNADYKDSWQKQGITGTLCRISDKLTRIETLADGTQALVAEEKLGQTLMDNIGYSFLALLWLGEHGQL